MKVAMVSEHASPLAVLGGVDAGGQNVYVAALSQELARRGAEVVVHTRRDDAEVPRRVQLAPGVVVDHVTAGPAERIPNPIDTLLPYMDEFAEDLAEQWSRERPDLVHSHFWMSGRAALAAAAPLGIPVLHTFHALGVVKRRHQGAKDTSPPERIPEERAIIAAADRIISTCSDEVFELARLDADRRKISVVPCGVNLGLFRPDGPVAARTPGMHRVVCVTRFVERKGVGNVVAALADVPDTELVIAGGPAFEDLPDDPEYRRLTELARDVGVFERVRFTGRLERSEVPTLLRSADVVACVPWYEPFGIVPLEAMACGVPVLGSAVGGLLDTVVHGVTGVHVPPRRPDRIAESLRELLADPSWRAALGRAGRDRARARYGWERVARSVHAVYEETREEAAPARASANGRRSRFQVGHEHLAALAEPLAQLDREVDRIGSWGRRLARILVEGGRVLAAGNGGSAAQAQHLTSELVGRYRDERLPLSAIALHADTSSLTAISNDYGCDEAFARQVRAHGRPGDVLVALSTSGQSPNVVAAVEAAREGGLTSLALTGPAPNPVAESADDAVEVDAEATATIQEIHQVAIHLLCAAVDAEVRVLTAAPDEAVR